MLEFLLHHQVMDELNRLNVVLTIPPLVLTGILLKARLIPQSAAVMRRGRPFTGEEWTLFGWTTGFIGFFFNAFLWGVHFFTASIHWQAGFDFTYALGPVGNIVTRHIPYTISALCHLIGFAKFVDRPSNVHWWAFGGSVISCVILYVIMAMLDPL